ncbi:conserved hypothetical protein [Kribbella flavida DSM 17836]|uniref:Uncharacterized protein n=1 Tax=Kribbella flavida (strain DSM 17836 / JCM 10339 / NBRC 14399) TaxID=479435 RepID=D2PUM0_KRIFD|nr:hypothetical protein [Kribbella flavida]ADB29538.1 conserved hypothetical protein [Kribbella flavida DSM 17836]
MSVYELIARLPGIDAVRRTSRALAVLDAVLSPDPEYRYYSFDARWSPTDEAALMRNGSGDEYSIVFSPDGAIAQGFDHESPMSPRQSPGGRTWPGLFIGVPDELAPALDEPAFRDGDGNQSVTVCFWRTPADDRWLCGPVEGADKDGAERLFGLLAEGPEGYLTFAEDHYEVALDLDAIRHVYALMPLTEYVVTSLNRERRLADLTEEIAEIGYPRS